MSQSKKISVLIPNFNAANYVGQAIESILSQTVLPDEIIVVDDASTDDSWKIITNFADKYDFIKIYRNEKNSGVAYTRNRLISKASGFYLVFLDSDDLSLPTRIERQLNFLSNNEDVDVCGTNFYLIDKGNNIIGEKKFLETDTQCKKMMWRCPFGNNTIMIKKRCFDLLGGYDEEFLLAEDLDVWLRFSSKFKFYNIQENLVMYRIHGQNSLDFVNNLFVEYHSFNNEKQQLSKILNIIENNNFRYFIETVTRNKSPFLGEKKNTPMDLQLNIYCWKN